MRRAILVASMVLLACPFASAVERSDPTKTNYLVFPAKKPANMTELQRTFERQDGSAPNYRVLINASPAVRPDGTIDPQAIDWKALEEEIHERVRIRVGKQRYRIVIDIAYYGRRPNEESRRLFYWALKGMAMDFGYDEIDVGTTFRTDDDAWNQDIKLKHVYDLIGKGKVKESAFDHDLVTVYPVRNPYSRRVLGDADCVVEIKRPDQKGEDGTLTKQEEAAIAATVARLNLSSKGIIYFRIRGKFGATRAVRTFCDETGKNLARKLGFKSHVTHIAEK